MGPAAAPDLQGHEEGIRREELVGTQAGKECALEQRAEQEDTG